MDPEKAGRRVIATLWYPHDRECAGVGLDVPWRACSGIPRGGRGPVANAGWASIDGGAAFSGARASSPLR